MLCLTCSMRAVRAAPGFRLMDQPPAAAVSARPGRYRPAGAGVTHACRKDTPFGRTSSAQRHFGPSAIRRNGCPPSIDLGAHDGRIAHPSTVLTRPPISNACGLVAKPCATILRSPARGTASDWRHAATVFVAVFSIGMARFRKTDAGFGVYQGRMPPGYGVSTDLPSAAARGS